MISASTISLIAVLCGSVKNEKVPECRRTLNSCIRSEYKKWDSGRNKRNPRGGIVYSRPTEEQLAYRCAMKQKLL